LVTSRCTAFASTPPSAGVEGPDVDAVTADGAVGWVLVWLLPPSIFDSWMHSHDGCVCHVRCISCRASVVRVSSASRLCVKGHTSLVTKSDDGGDADCHHAARPAYVVLEMFIPFQSRLNHAQESVVWKDAGWVVCVCVCVGGGGGTLSPAPSRLVLLLRLRVEVRRPW
jgi:hypothetical protein